MELRQHSNETKNEDIKINEATPSNQTIVELDKIKKKKPKSIHLGHRARLKSQFLTNGFDALTDIQKLELLLFYAIPQKDTNPIAHNLLDYFGSFKDVIEADYNELLKVSGIKENSALLINLINSFNNYCHKPVDLENADETKNTIEFVRNLYHGVTVEQLYVLCVTKGGAVKKYQLIASGSAEAMHNVQIRTITQAAIENKCNRIILCHNHPQGKAKMSDEDISFTYSVLCSCMLNDIDLLDHVIVGCYNDDFSASEAGVMRKLKKRAEEKIIIPKETRLFLSASTKQYKISKHIDFDFDINF